MLEGYFLGLCSAILRCDDFASWVTEQTEMCLSGQLKQSQMYADPSFQISKGGVIHWYLLSVVGSQEKR